MIGRGKTVLLVEGSAVMRQMALSGLRGLSFDRVISVETPDEAPGSLVVGPIHLALIDTQIGARSGFDLAADIRAGRLSVPSDLPLIMLAWQAEPKTVATAQELKINGLLIKPLSTEELRRRVTGVMVNHLRA